MSKPGKALRRLLRAPVYLFRLRVGRLLGHRFLLLTHAGRRTGRRHQTVLEVVDYREGPAVIVMSGWGHASDWLRNIGAGGPAHVDVGGQHFDAGHRILAVDEAMRVFERYERRNRWIAPIVRRVLSGLVGWEYRGSEDDRRRLVEQLPFVELFPAHG